MYWYAGQLFSDSQISLETDNPGLLYGATVFTTLRIYHYSLAHPLTAWKEHCDRLHQNLATFAWTEPNWHHIQHGAKHLSQHFPVLRITLFPDGREWITGRNLPQQWSQWRTQGIQAWVAPPEFYQRSLPQQKTGNYLTAWLARQQALQQGFQEAILTDHQGHWLETSTGNLWGWGQGRWWTPPITAGILPGIVRNQLLKWLEQQGSPACEVPWSAEQLREFEAIAYSNSVIQVLPIAQVWHQEQCQFYPAQHPAFKLLDDFFRFWEGPNI